MSPKQALKILIMLLIATVIIIGSFYIVNKYFLNKFQKKGQWAEISEHNPENEVPEIDIPEYTEEERQADADERIEKEAARLIEKDIEEKGKIVSTTREAIVNMANEETRRREK